MISLIYALWTVFIAAACSICLAENFTVPSQEYRTITHALMKAREGDTVYVLPGEYREQIVINNGVTLISQERFAAVLKGNGRGNTVAISGTGTILGFDITRGVTGVFTRSVGAKIKECRIYKNRGSGILCAGSLPVIEDCVIVFNGGSGIQAFDIVGGASTIAHNTIAFNLNNGILLNSSVPLRIQNNIIAKNRANPISCVENPELVSMSHNVLYDNFGRAFEIPRENFSFDPLFFAPKKRTINFSLQKDSPALNRSKNGDDLGARINNPSN